MISSFSASLQARANLAARARSPRAGDRPSAGRYLGGRALLACLCLAAALLAIFATPAFAKQARIFTGSFGAAGSSTPNPYPLSQPSSVAVDDVTGDVYVADPENHRVEKFTGGGELLLIFGKEVNKTKTEEAATTAAERNVCVISSGDVCQPGAAASTPGAFATTVALLVAVDNSSAPSQGNLYVADSSIGGGGDIVTKFDSQGHLISTWAAGGQLDGTTTPNGHFNDLIGVGVGSTGNLWVDAVVPEVLGGQTFQKQGLSVFTPGSTFLTSWNSHVPIGASLGIAVDSADHVYVSDGSGVVEFSSQGTRIKVVNPGQTFPIAIASDLSNDDLYLRGFPQGVPTLQRYQAACESPGESGCQPDESFGSNRLPSGETGLIAVDGASTTHPVYAATQKQGQVLTFSLVTVPDVTTGIPTSLSPGNATLNGTVNPSGLSLSECFFEYGETIAYGHTVACESPSAAEVGSGSSPVAVHAQLSGLAPETTVHYRLVATNANDAAEPSSGEDVAFGPPIVLSESATAVTSNEATLDAEVEPNNADSQVHFEYGTTTAYGFSTPTVDLGSGSLPQGYAPHVAGLLPGTAYHYRVVAESALGTATGPDQIFLTQGTAPFALPDARFWEQVSPPQKHGALIEAFSGNLNQAATAGGAFTFVTTAPTEAEPEGYGGSQNVLAVRGSTGWHSRDIGSPHQKPTGLNSGEYAFFNQDLSEGILQAKSVALLSPAASEATPYLRTNFDPASPESFCGGATCFQPLVTGCPSESEECPPAVAESANVPPGNKFGTHCTGRELECGPEAIAATPDLSDVILATTTGGTPFSLQSGTPPASLYEWSRSTGQLLPVSVLPGGALDTAEPVLGFQNDIARNALSSDGSRIFFSDRSRHLFLYDASREEGLQIDAPQAGVSPKGGPSAVFESASADGSSVMFLDQQSLTANSGASENKPDLYNCEILIGPGGHLECQLTDLTPLHEAEAASVRGLVLGASEDGSAVYFVANGALAAGAEPGQCAENSPPTDRCNLYLARRTGGAWETHFIASLAIEDQNDWSGEGIRGQLLLFENARVSPSGRWLAFMSERPLTGYDSRDVQTGRPSQEVYLFHSAESGASGTLICASCNPTGARPQGVKFTQLTQGLDSSEEGLRPNRDQMIAASLPIWSALPFSQDRSRYQPRYLSDSGRLFFNSSDSLVPQDTNATGDVYQYEPASVGTCAPTSQNFSAASQGCVDLISSGTSPEESGFLGASESGNDVFFFTAAKLSASDLDGVRDVYDAHVCSAGSPCPPAPALPPLPCSGEACQPAAGGPAPPSPGSLSTNGAGNPKPRCKKGRVRRRGKCVKPHRKQHRKPRHSKQPHTSKHNGRHGK